jgi:two-component system, chemotaxis family, chemotaxis protein CheY
MKILIAEDSQFIRGILKDMLLTKNYEVLEAENGRIALELVKSENPDLLLLDIIMPEVDGMDVLKQLAGKIPVIVISAVGQEKMIEEAKSLGAKAYVIKPFEEKKVLEAIEATMA